VALPDHVRAGLLRHGRIVHRELWAIGLSLALQLLMWVATFTIQIPIQVELSNAGLSLPRIERLISANWWLRRVPMLINSMLFLWMMSLVLRRSEEASREA
jgi:hypothetical protein